MRKNNLRIGFLFLILLIFQSFVQDKRIKLFLLGDSITLQYSPYLESYLEDQFSIERKSGDQDAFRNLDIPQGANGGDSRMVLNFLRHKISDSSFSSNVVLLNCGLHDIKRQKSTGRIAVDTTEYRENLQKIYGLLDNEGIKLIWVRSTEVVDTIHSKNPQFIRYSKDLELYNSIADEVFRHNNIPIIDLFSFTKKLGDQRFVDHVHYTDEVKKLQASYIAGFLQRWGQQNRNINKKQK